MVDTCQRKLEISSSAYSEALQYRHDLLPITTSREHNSLPIHVQKITVARAQEIRKYAV